MNEMKYPEPLTDGTLIGSAHITVDQLEGFRHDTLTVFGKWCPMVLPHNAPFTHTFFGDFRIIV